VGPASVAQAEATYASGLNLRRSPYYPRASAADSTQPARGPAPVRIHVEEGFSGDIEAQGVAEFLQITFGDDQASFVGVERVTGSIRGRSGTFVLQDAGTLNGTTVSGTWFMVPGSGNGDLRGFVARAGSPPSSASGRISRSTTGSSEPTLVGCRRRSATGIDRNAPLLDALRDAMRRDRTARR